ncbi:MAG: HlyD family secretion protein [Lysobacter sp.]
MLGNIVITETRISHRFVIVMALVGMALLAWGALARYPRTERVMGMVVTSMPSAKVFAPRPGVVERLYVSNGEIVRKGQALAFVALDLKDRTQRSAAGSTLVALSHQQTLVQEQLANEKLAYDHERVRITAALSANTTERQSVGRQADIQRSIVRTASETLDRLAPLAAQGFISGLEFQGRQQEALVERQRLEQLLQQHTQLAARGSDLAAQLQALPSMVDKRSAELGERLQVISQQQARARVDVGYTVTSPVNGRITSLQAPIGRSVDARVPLLAVVPVGAVFEVEVFAPSKAVGFIREGQEVRLMYDAFPYKQYGAFGGRISAISQASFGPTELDVPLKLEEPVYRVRVRLDQQSIPTFRRVLHLQSGMTLSASIVLERRTFLDLLLEPLNAVRKRT